MRVLRFFFARPWRRYVSLAVLTLLSVLLILRILLMTPLAHDFVAAQIERADVRGQQIQVDGLKGDLFGRITAEQITVEDASGAWLSINDVELAWGPMALLSSELNLKRLAAREISVRRQPELAPSTTESQASFVKRYRLQELEIARLNLANGIAGPAQSYAIAGELEATNTTGQLLLDLKPTAAFGDQLNADITWGGETPIQGEVEILGAPSGLFAALLGLPSGAPFEATLSASGDMQNWDLTALAEVEAAQVLDFRLARSGETYQSAGTVTLTPFRRLQPIAARLGPRLSVSGETDAEGMLFVTLQSESGSAVLQGLVNETDGQTEIEDFVFALTELDLAAVSGLEQLRMSTARAEGRLEIRQGNLIFDGSVSVPEFAYGRYAVNDLQSRGRHAWQGGELSVVSNILSARPRGLPNALGARLASRIEGDVGLTFTPSTRRFLLNRADMTSGAQRITGQGFYTMGGPINLAGQVRLQNLAPLQSIGGAWRAEGDRLSDLNLRFAGPAVPAGAASMLRRGFGETINLNVTVDRRADDYFVRSFTAQSQRVQAQASGELSNGRLQIMGTATAAQLDLPSVLASEVAAEFKVSGLVSAPALTISSTADEILAAGEMVTSPVLRANSTLSASPQFDLNLNAAYRDAPIGITLAGNYGAGTIALDAMELAWADLLATGSGRVDLDAIEQSTLDLMVSGRAPLVRNIEGHIVFANRTLDADVEIVEAAFGGVDLRTAQLDASGAWPQFSGDLTYAGEVPLFGSEEPISGTHALALDADARTLSVTGESTLIDQRIQMPAPILVEFSDALTLRGTVVAFDGTIDLDLDNSGQTRSRLIASNIAMRRLGVLVQRPGLRGELSGTAELGFDEEMLQGEAAFRIENLSRGDSPRANLDLNATVEGNRLSANLIAEDQEDSLSLEVTAQTDLQHASSLISIRPVPGAAVPIEIRGGGPVAPLWALAAPSDLRLEGDFEVDVSNGAGDEFRFVGPVAFRAGVFEDGFTGLHLENILALADLSADGITLSEASARGGNSGRIEASGAYRFDGNGEVTLELRRLNALNRSDVSAEISGRATMDRRARRTRIRGDLEVDEARINLSKLPGAGYTTLEVVFPEPGTAIEQATPVREAISLNLDVSADRRIFVTGPGIDSEWGLNARVTGPAGAPQLNGRATLVRGEADLLSRSFRLTEGVIRFVGDPEDSDVSLRADRTSDGITTSIVVAGTVTDPDISLTSDPSLPDDEILARALFGRSPSNLSPLQAAQLAAAAAQLAGGDALSLTGQLEAATGLDRLDFGFDEDGEATLSTGKYLADDLYLEIESGASGAPGVALEWTPLANVEFDAEIDPELGPKVAIQWRRDFDRLPGEAEPEPATDEAPARPSGTE
ncbi:MAG: translocation/assembly module TamB domain-containing protein [Hyphomonadaceae bacterium]|nr:translocation/assembly module TamB domain-containing protein [Hyphomonadaceae bacterium]